MPTVNSAQIVTIKVDDVNPVCIYCGLSFDFNCDLASHIAGSHFDNVYHCVVCDSVRYETKELFVAHMKTHSAVTFTDDQITYSILPVLVDLNESSQPTGNKSTSQLDLKKKNINIQKQSIVGAQMTNMVLRYPCDVCERTFSRPFDLKRHMQRIHSVNLIEQAKSGRTEIGLISPKKRISTKDTFFCNVCNAEFKRRFDLKRHMRSRHVLATCIQMLEPNTNAIKTITSSAVEIQAHNLTQTRNIFSLQASKLENSSFKSILLLDKSVQQQEYSCLVCKKIFPNKPAMVSHSESHTLDEQAQASAEMARLSEEAELIKKAEEVVDGRTFYRCPQCNHLIRVRNAFIEHLRIHSGLKPFTCHVCGKQFRVLSFLTRHIQDVHEKLRRFPCDICGQRFANASARNDHRRIHTGERPFVCHVCGKAFKSKSSLFSHNRYHINNFPHMCSICDKRFRTLQKLKIHTTLHTREKSHICNLCGKAFRLDGCLRRHKQNHERKEQVHCEICGKSFPQLRYLKLHARTHNVRMLSDTDT